MTQSWRSLTFLHWEFAAEAVQNLLPAGLAVDTWEGKAYVGLVPFRMENVRFVRGGAIVGARDFPETNVRTYVIGPNGEPGVWFFSLDASSPHAAAGGRVLYGLPYHYARMRVDESEREVRYQSHRRLARCQVATQVPKETAAAEPGTFEFWLVERYLLFSHFRNRIWSGQVHHPPYQIAPVSTEVVENTMYNLLGLSPEGPPIAHFSPGVDVDVFALRPIQRSG